MLPHPVLVLGPVVHEQEEPRGGQAIDHDVQQGLGLAVDPVEVLDDHEERLNLALAQEEALDRVQRALAPLGGIEPLPLGILSRHVQEGQQGREGRLQGVVEVQQLGASKGSTCAWWRDVGRGVDRSRWERASGSAEAG